MQSLARVEPNIYLAIELSASTWLVAAQLPTSDKIGMHRIDAGDTAALLELIRKLQARVRTKLGCNEVTVASCHVCSVVRVPTPDEEDAKRQHREREHLVQERGSGLRIGSRRCWRPRALGSDHYCALGIAIWKVCGRATGGRSRCISAPSSIACAAGL